MLISYTIGQEGFPVWGCPSRKNIDDSEPDQVSVLLAKESQVSLWRKGSPEDSEKGGSGAGDEVTVLVK